MRRSRRGGGSGLEIGGSGEDSFVAVVVTKLTGALLFILLLTMVIMALIPKAIDNPRPSRDGSKPPPVLAIATPARLPEAISGRPYQVALSATGGSGALRWDVEGHLPEGLTLDPSSGLIEGTPTKATTEPAELTLKVGDGEARAARMTKLVVYQPDSPLTTPSKWKPNLPPIPWKSWMEQGFGFLVLLLVMFVGLNLISGLERLSRRGDPEASPSKRFLAYRAVLLAATIASAAGLAAWLVQGKGRGETAPQEVAASPE